MSGVAGERVRVGLTLPSFQPDPERVLTVARAAEEAGLDGVFLFDHLFRARGDGPGAERRPALELMTMVSAVAAATGRIAVGTLVARATLRPPAILRTGFDTVARIAPGRIIAGLGAGDDESIAENLAFGVESPALDPDELAAYRLARLEATARELTGRDYPVWIAARTPAARRIAATHATGWNHWGSDVKAFAAAAYQMRTEVAAAGRVSAVGGASGVGVSGVGVSGGGVSGVGGDFAVDGVSGVGGDSAVGARDPGAGRDPGFTCTWGGLAVLGGAAAEAEAKWERLGRGRPGIVHGTPPEVADQIAAYASAGAHWVILGPIDSSDPGNAVLLGEARRILLGLGTG